MHVHIATCQRCLAHPWPDPLHPVVLHHAALTLACKQAIQLHPPMPRAPHHGSQRGRKAGDGQQELEAVDLEAASRQAHAN
jgi:hypothetical protein